MGISPDILKKLIEAIRKGDKKAFAELYDRYSPSLYGVVYRIVHSKAAAEDVIQESFVKIWKYFPKYDEKKGTLFTWMLNITRNTAIDRLRKEKRLATSIQNQKAHVDKVKQSTEITTDAIGLGKVIGELSKEQQEVIEYIYFNGYTHQEVSDELNLPLGTVKTRIRSAIKKLRGLFNN